MIKKFGNLYKILAKNKDKEGKQKVLGTYKSEKEAKERLRQIEYFKHNSKAK